MSSVKHASFCSGPMRGKPVTALPGIGETYGYKLSCVGYSLASDLYEKFKTFDFDSNKCQNWLYMAAGVNSRYSSMCYEAIKDWHEQFGEIRSSARYSNAQHSELQLLTPPRRISEDNHCYRNLTPPHQDSPNQSKDFGITRDEVMRMMAQYQTKLDTMASRINELEKEKTSAAAKISNLEKEQLKTNNYVKSLEARVKQIDRIAVVLQKQQNTSVEQQKNISSSIYLLSQKLEETIMKQSKLNQDSIVSTLIKILEARIERIEDTAKKIHKEQNKNFLELNKHINNINARTESTRNIPLSIDILSRRLEEITKKQSKGYSSIEESFRFKQMEKDLSNLTIEISNLINRNGDILQEPAMKNDINSNIQDKLSNKNSVKTIINKISNKTLNIENTVSL